jgi:hypothetical protein
LRSQFPLLRLKGIENYITLSATSIMMLGVLVLLEAKARGHLLRYNVAEGFWVFIGLLRDLCCGRVFVGVFFFMFSCPFCLFLFLHPFVYFLYAQRCLYFL